MYKIITKKEAVEINLASRAVWPTYSPRETKQNNILHRVSFFYQDIMATENVIDMATELKCFWLFDVISSYYKMIIEMDDYDYHVFVCVLKKPSGEGCHVSIVFKDDRVIIQDIGYTSITENVYLNFRNNVISIPEED